MRYFDRRESFEEVLSVGGDEELGELEEEADEDGLRAIDQGREVDRAVR